MNTPIRITKAVRTCYACPAQWSATTDDGREVYVRFRWGHGYVEVAGERVFDWDDGTGMGGIISYDDLVALTKGLIEWPVYEESMGEFEP